MYVWFFVFHINRMENSVLGNALEGVPEESEEEEQPSSSNVETPDNPDGQYLGASDFFFLKHTDNFSMCSKSICNE